MANYVDNTEDVAEIKKDRARSAICWTEVYDDDAARSKGTHDWKVADGYWWSEVELGTQVRKMEYIVGRFREMPAVVRGGDTSSDEPCHRNLLWWV